MGIVGPRVVASREARPPLFLLSRVLECACFLLRGGDATD